MARASLWRQLKVLLKRNLLLKKRVKSSTIQEIAFPLYFVIILAIIRVAVRPRTQPTIIGFPEHDLSKAFGQPNRNLTLTKIFITPDNLDTRTIGAGLATRLGLSPDSIVYFYNETTAVNAYVENPKNVFGIHFDKLQDNATSYELRVPIKSMPTALSNLYGSQGSCRSSTEGLAAFSCPANSYIFSGFANLQAVIDAEIIGLKGNRSFPSPKINVQMMPKGEFTPNVAWIQILSSIYLVMAYGPFVSFLASFLVFEKEKKIKENMKIMGLNGTAFWLSWFIIYTVLIFIVTIVVTLIGFLLFERSNLFLFFLMLMMYGLSIVNFGFILSTFFDKPQSASAVASLVPLIFSLLYLAVSLTRSYTIDGPVSSIPNVGQWFLCLLSPVALALSVDQGLYLDIARGGMNFETMHFGQFPLWSSLTMLAVDVVLYGLLAAYLDNVVPSEYGMKRPLWFCFMPSFWCPREIKEEDLILSEHGFEDNATVEAVSGDIEPVSTEFKSKDVLRMFNIKKTFKGKKGANVVAVDGINMALYEGQITALLGHNGAGKTTLINMLTGLNPPTSGSATLYGLDVSDTNDMDQIRTMTGVCPQHNILFDKLSCVEHLVVFGSLRGIPEDQIEKQIENVLGDVDLSDQADTLAENLSGGQKRKLCVAIALIGSPKIIFLDEPTAGMDPYSRRHLWSLLKQRRKGRIIVLTTHFMDEADILADRKAVISKGKLRCCGSSMYLKNKFGIGYHLTMVVDGKHNTSAVTDLVHRHISSANLGHEHANELAYTLPHSKVEKFPELFSAIEKSQEANEDTPEYLGITSYGISMTTLEEVFLKLEEASVDDEPDVPNGSASDKDNDKPAVAINMQETPTANNVEFTANGLDSRACQIVEPVDLDKARFKTLVMLRFRIALRNPFSFTFRILFPALFVIIGVAVMRFSPAPVPVFEAAPKPFAISAFNYIASQGIPNTPYRYEDNTGGSPNVARMLADLSAITQVQEFNSSTDLLAVAPTNLASRFYAVNGPPGFDVNYTALYNDTAIHSLPSIINLMSNSLLNLVLNDTNRPHQIMTANKPWPSIEVGSAQWNQAAFSSVILVGLAMTIVPAGMAGLIVKDRECKARSQLRVQGVTMNMYWGSTFLADIIQFCIPTLITVIAVLAFQVPSYRPGGAILSLILLYLLYMPVLTLCGYNISFLFNRFETAGAIIPQLFTYLSFVPYIPVSIVDLSNPQAAAIMHYVFCIIDPLYGVFGGIYYIDRVYTRASFTQTNPQLSVSDYFKWESNIIFPLLMAFVHVAWLYFLLRYLEVRKYGGDTKDVVGCVKKKDPVSVVPETNDDVIEDEDEDVATERSRIINWNPAVDKAPVVMVKGLRKEFSKRIKNSGFCKKVPDTVKTKVAVRNSTFGVEGGEVFGLLGPNGAGKTTTMNMIIAEEGPTNGKVTVAGHDIRSSLSDAFQAMGYCPQHDPLWDVITTKEHISTYAIMRGIHPNDVKGITQFFLKSLRIEEHADKHAKKLSGGTKRKLCYALSMLGKPDVVLMDEPSTGMDPRSKRYLWDTISSCFRGTERGGILTTHYMEEADALCNRVAIMVNGQMECIGSTQRLKDRHGKGYVLEVKLQVVSNDSAELEDRVEGLDEFVQGVFPTSERMECFGERITYKLPQSDVTSLATAFSALEQGKMQFNIEEYSFSQSTLEQVFLEFAKRQKEEEIDDKDEELVKAEAAKERSNSARRRLNSQHSRTGYSNLGAEADDITAQVKKPAVSTYL